MLYYVIMFLPLIPVVCMIATGRILLRRLAVLALCVTLLSPFLTRIIYWLTPTPATEFITFKAIGDILTIWLFTLILLSLLRQEKWSGLIILDALDWLVIIYIIWGLLFVFHPNQSIVQGIWGFKENTLPIMWYFLARLLVRNSFHLRRLLWGLGIFLILNNLYAIFQKLYGLALPFDFYYFSTYLKSFIAKHGERVYISGFLTGVEGLYVVAIISILCFGLRKELPFFKGVRWLLWSSLIALFMLHPERTAVVMTAIGITVTLFVSSIKKPLYATALLVAIVLATTLLIMSRSVVASQLTSLGGQHAYFAWLFTPESDISLQMRLNENWKLAWELLRKYPMGIGMGNLTISYATRFGTEWIGPHNYFLQVALGYSLPGLMLFILVILGLVKRDLSLALWSRDPFLKASGATKVGITLAMLVASLVVLPFTGISGSCYWLVIGLRYTDRAKIHSTLNNLS